jgi:hypothetical protein
MRMRVWLPLLCALCAFAGAARAGVSPFWSRFVFKESGDSLVQYFQIEPHVGILLHEPQSFGLVQRIEDGPEKERPKFFNLGRQFVPLMDDTLLMWLQHEPMVAEQHPSFPPAAARRTEGTSPVPRVTEQKEPA